MKTSTRNEPNDPETAKLVSQPGTVEEKANMAVRCRLCRETIVVETNFRPTQATCLHCGLKFVFVPQREPLPVNGLRLRYSEVLEAQRRPGTVQHKRHDAHVRPTIQYSQPKTNHLAWVGDLALSLSSFLVSLGRWFQRLLAR
ncbi:MAG: hypothetical protein WCJ35_20145 [Planctomycetota bacterium]